MKEEETIPGFNIPKRKLTKKERQLPMTYDRIQLFHYSVGEDLFDQLGYLLDTKTFLGYLMAKLPELSKQMIKCHNDPPCGDTILALLELFEEEYGEEAGNKLIYTHFADFINLTEVTLAKFNQVLIQVEEHYNH